jgi:hypothetical protein
MIDSKFSEIGNYQNMFVYLYTMLISNSVYENINSTINTSTFNSDLIKSYLTIINLNICEDIQIENTKTISTNTSLNNIIKNDYIYNTTSNSFTTYDDTIDTEYSFTIELKTYVNGLSNTTVDAIITEITNINNNNLTTVTKAVTTVLEANMTLYNLLSGDLENFITNTKPTNLNFYNTVIGLMISINKIYNIGTTESLFTTLNSDFRNIVVYNYYDNSLTDQVTVFNFSPSLLSIINSFDTKKSTVLSTFNDNTNEFATQAINFSYISAPLQYIDYNNLEYKLKINT